MKGIVVVLGRFAVSYLKFLDERMQKMSEVLDQVNAKVDALVETVDAVVVELGELKAAVDAAVANNDAAGMAAVGDRIDGLRVRLAGAATAADITPETPVPGAPAPEPAPEPSEPSA